MFRVVPQNVNINFAGKQKTFLSISVVVVFICLVILSVKSLKFGTDFSGGTEIQVRVADSIKIKQVREALAETAGRGLGTAEVQNFGTAKNGEHDFLVKVEKTSLIQPQESEAIKANLVEKYGKDLRYEFNPDSDKIELRIAKDETEADFRTFIEAQSPKLKDAKIIKTLHLGKTEFLVSPKGVSAVLSDILKKNLSTDVKVLRVDFVGAKVGRELRDNGILSVIVTIGLILFYIALRFDFYFAPGAVLALVHDVAITVGIFSLLQKEFNLPTVAAILTIVGYSLNDTVVVFDRIRDNQTRFKGKSLSQIVNTSINETLSRTILTSVTTLVVVLVLFFFGGGIIHDFSFALLIGVMVGTYSSIFIASPVFVMLKDRFEGQKS